MTVDLARQGRYRRMLADTHELGWIDRCITPDTDRAVRFGAVKLTDACRSPRITHVHRATHHASMATAIAPGPRCNIRPRAERRWWTAAEWGAAILVAIVIVAALWLGIHGIQQQ